MEVVLDRMFSWFVLWSDSPEQLLPNRQIRRWGASAVSAGSFWLVFMFLGLNTSNAQLRAQTDQEFRFILRCSSSRERAAPRHRAVNAWPSALAFGFTVAFNPCCAGNPNRKGPGPHRPRRLAILQSCRWQ